MSNAAATLEKLLAALKVAPALAHPVTGRAKFYDTTDTQPIDHVARLQVRSFVSGAKIKFDDGDEYVLEQLGEAIEGPWSKIQLTGTAKLRIWHDQGGPLASTVAIPPGTSTLELGDKVTATNGAEAIALNANAARRAFGLQNFGIFPVAVALQSGMNGGTGQKVVAVLAACTVALDGTGGTFSLAGWTGAVYVWGIGGAADVGVGAI